MKRSAPAVISRILRTIAILLEYWFIRASLSLAVGVWKQYQQDVLGIYNSASIIPFLREKVMNARFVAEWEGDDR
jgi:hypothetical protein